MSATHHIIRSICHPELVKEIKIEQEELLADNDFYIGIVIPTFNRPEYLKYTLFSLSHSDLKSRKIVILIFDDGSAECTEQLIKEFTIEHVPIIKIFSNKINIVHQNNYTILPGNAFPYTIRYGCEILFNLGAKYVMNSDSDAMFCPNWLSIIDSTLMHIHDEQFILAGFRCADKFHRVTYEGEHYRKLVTLGGINYLCNRNTFFNTVQSCIYDYAFDWILSSVCEQKQITIYLTKQSIVQHIGVHSSIIRGENNYLSKCYECNVADITLDKMIELDNAVKQLHDFPHADDFNLIEHTLFDIVIPVGPNDYNRIHDTIQYTKRNVLHYRNIYIVSPNTITIDGCIYIPETIFPITVDYIKSLDNCKEKAGWYMQQLIKLYAGSSIPGILENYLILDADVYVVKPTTFMRGNIPLYALGKEHHMPYFRHMFRLHPTLFRVNNVSGICHHMMFTQKYLQELFALVETPTVPFWMRFLYEVQESGSGASEYEIYFNFMLAYHKNDMIIRELCWRDVSRLDEVGPEHDLVALHYYLRPIVSVNVMGGLGNQLFQIAAAYSYAKQQDGRLQIFHAKENGNRPLYWNSILSCMKPYLVDSIPPLKQWHEDVATMYKKLPSIDQHGLYLNGYLQSSTYHVPEIKQMFKASLTKELSEKYQFLLSNKDHVIIMHSRQTDYQLYRDIHGPLDIMYYVRALPIMTQNIPHPFIVLCGDDNQFWKQMKLPYPHMILEESDINTFALLQQFHHFIMSNSTFIWWCTYLADAKKVIAPAKWFGPAGPQLYEDIYESSWIRI
jgi:glycosyltransferase involved in cell wall biosynthesis